MFNSKAVFRRFLFVVTVLLSGFTHSNENQVHLTSLEWPPYSGEHLPDGGVSVAIAKRAFKNMGYELIVDFFPWSRAVQNGTNPKMHYAGYFPEYYSPKLAEQLYFSDDIGESPLGLLENVDKPVTWEKISDLSSYSIGVVRDYVNTQALDAAIESGRQSVQEVTSDAQNIRKVAGNRIPLAVIDSLVLEYLLSTDQSLKPHRDQVRMNKHLLENKKLFVCFQKSTEGERLLKIFNDGLKQIDIADFVRRYFRKIGITRSGEPK